MGEPSAEYPTIRRHAEGGFVWTICSECGPDVAVDCDGCCIGCGEYALRYGRAARAPGVSEGAGSEVDEWPPQTPREWRLYWRGAETGRRVAAEDREAALEADRAAFRQGVDCAEGDRADLENRIADMSWPEISALLKRIREDPAIPEGAVPVEIHVYCEVDDVGSRAVIVRVDGKAWGEDGDILSGTFVPRTEPGEQGGQP